MSSGKKSPDESAYLKRGLDIAVRIGILAVIVFACFRIFSPFLVPVVWAVIIAVALYPLFLKLKGLLGGKNRLAGVVFILVSLAAVIVPTWMLSESLIEGTVELGQKLQDGTYAVGPPPDKVRTWPVVGEGLYDTWFSANQNLAATVEKLEPQIKKLGTRLVKAFAAFGVAVLQTVIALIIAGVLMTHSAGGARLARAIGARLAGEQGVQMVEMSGATISSVVKGVVLIALIQSVAAGIGMVVMDVPLAGLWALLVLIVAVIQVPPAIILIPVIIYVFSTNDNTVANVIFGIYALVVAGADNFLKPLLLGRGVDVPMLVILIGAIGGMIVTGVIGLFIGAVVLAVGYNLFISWIAESYSEEGAAIESGSKSG